MSLRNESRKEYVTRGDVAHIGELQVGALQRIADAVEKMATERSGAVNDELTRQVVSLARELRGARRQCAILRGVVTKFKNKKKRRRHG